MKVKTIADYIGQDAIDEILAVLEYGDEKHPGEHWKSLNYREHIRHAMGHISEYIDCGIDYDPETVRLHLAHVACRILFALALELKQREDG